jgi:hypothetical protein
MRWPILTLVIFLVTACGKPASTKQNLGSPESLAAKQEAAPKNFMEEAAQVAALIDPLKLSTLRERGANPRIQKITAILWTAKAAGKNPESIATQAVAQIGWGGTEKGNLTAAAILRNLDIAEKLGAITPEDISAMRHGKAATVRKGPYTGDLLSVDHIIPRAVVPELDNVICNLELLPLKLNQTKGDKISDRQRDLAKKIYAAGLLASHELPE